jgi:hypothetical protein
LEDPLANDPVRIVVVGGSVTAGVASCANHVGLPDVPSPGNMRCAWPDRLGRVLNEVLFRAGGAARGGGGGDTAVPSNTNTTAEVFDVWNAAVPGFDSGMGAILFEYQLLEGLNSRRPHVVISAYSPNDAKDADPVSLWLTGQQELVKSAHKLRPCDDDLPLIVLADDLYGDVQLEALEQTGFLYKTASWYNLMGIMYSNVGRHASVAHWNGSHHVDPMFGSKFDVHLGTGFHIAMAWTVLFNFVDALYETCVDDAETGVPPPSESPDVTASSSPFREPNTKYRGRYGPTHQVKREWEANVLAKERACNGSGKSSSGAYDDYPTTEPPRFATNVCTYGWIMHTRSSIAHPWHVDEAMEPFLVEANGWRAKPVVKRKAHPTRFHPRTGWFGDSPNATFTLLLTNLTMATTSLTVISMKSYGPEWANSTLQVRLTVTREQPRGGSGGAGQARRPGASSSSSSSSQTFTIDGHHETRTSVHFAHKLPLPGGETPANPGDTIRADFRLVSGSMFKIKGSPSATSDGRNIIRARRKLEKDNRRAGFNVASFVSHTHCGTRFGRAARDTAEATGTFPFVLLTRMRLWVCSGTAPAAVSCRSQEKSIRADGGFCARQMPPTGGSGGWLTPFP